MDYTIPIEKEKMVCAKNSLPISTKSSLVVCRAINRKNFNDAKKFLEDVLEGKRSIKGKFYTSAAEQILELLKSAEKNAKARGFETEAMKLMISSHKGARMYRARRKRAFGARMKSSNIQVVLQKIEKTKEEKK